MLDFVALTVLVEAAAAGSLAGAARRLRISPMAATRQLSALEQELGVRLMHRTTRSLALTEAGQIFLPHAQALLEEQAAAYASVRSTTAGASGLLRVTASAAFGRKVVAPLAAAFMHENPELRFDLLLTDSIVDIVAEGIDLAIRIAMLNDTSLVARRLSDNPRVLVASPGYLTAHPAPAVLAELQQHECLAATGATHWSFLAGERRVSVKIGGRFTASSVEGLHQACVGSLGIANLSLWAVRDELASGTLRTVTLADAESEPLAIWAIYPTRRMVPAKVRLFIDALHAHLRE